jgi:chromosome segregation ATPase
MIKKLIVAAVALVVLTSVWAIDPGGYVSTVASYFTKHVQPSLDFEIKRAENLATRLDKDIFESQEKLAREKVELAKLEEGLQKETVALQKRRDRLVALRDQMKTDETPVSVSNPKRTELARQLNHLKIEDRKHETNRKIYDARKQHFDALYDKVREMQANKEDMRLKLEYLKAELEAVRVDEARAKYTVDNSEFKSFQELLDKIETEVKTRRELADMRAPETETDTAPAATPEASNILDEVDAYLGKTPAKVANK